MDQMDRSPIRGKTAILCQEIPGDVPGAHTPARHLAASTSQRPTLDRTQSNHSRLRLNAYGFRSQGGWSIAEFMVAALLSIIVSGSAIMVLSNALASNARIMDRVQLSHELRTSMQMMTRDVRRAGYTAGSMWCLANTVCLPDVSINLPLDVDLPLLTNIELPAGIQINETNDCFRFELDRNHDGTVSASEHGAYRRRVVGGVGVLEVWLGNSAPDCTASSNDWSAITVASRIDINSFRVDDDLSVEQQVSVDLLGNTTNQKIRRIRLQLAGRLVEEPSLSEQLEDVIDVRNDILL